LRAPGSRVGPLPCLIADTRHGTVPMTTASAHDDKSGGSTGRYDAYGGHSKKRKLWGPHYVISLLYDAVSTA